MNPLVAPEAQHRGHRTALSVNVNKIALLRNTRHLGIPDVVKLAAQVLAAGAQGITVHPRPDARHIRSDDVLALTRSGDESPLRAFELVLLRETGVLPDLAVCTATQAKVLPARAYQLRADGGLGLATAAEAMRAPTLSGATCLAVQAALHRNDLAALRNATAADLPALKSQLRTLLVYHLGSPTLRTRQMMLDIRRLLDAAPAAPATPTTPAIPSTPAVPTTPATATESAVAPEPSALTGPP